MKKLNLTWSDPNSVQIWHEISVFLNPGLFGIQIQEGKKILQNSHPQKPMGTTEAEWFSVCVGPRLLFWHSVTCTDSSSWFLLVFGTRFVRVRNVFFLMSRLHRLDFPMVSMAKWYSITLILLAPSISKVDSPCSHQGSDWVSEAGR